MSTVLFIPNWWSIDIESIQKELFVIIDQYNSLDAQKLDIAMALAATAHKGQYRKNRFSDVIPYLIHPFRIVLSLYKEFNITDPDILVVGLLHDVLEDSDVKKEDFPEIINLNKITDLIQILTRKKKRTQKGDQLEDSYYKDIIKTGEWAIVLKLADKLDNLRDALFHPQKSKRQTYLAEGERVFLPLIKCLPKKIKPAIQKIFKSVIKKGNNGLGFAEFISIYFKAPVSLDVLAIKKEYPDLEKEIYSYLIINPALNFWLSYDKVHLIRLEKELDQKELIKNVLLLSIELFKTGSAEKILPEKIYRSIPKERKAVILKLLIRQIQLLIDLIENEEQEHWVNVLLEDSRYIFLALHSSYLDPASPFLSLWEESWVFNLKDAAGIIYRHLCLPGHKLQHYKELFQVMHLNRKALWRYHNYQGSAQLYETSLESLWQFSENSSARFSFRHVLSMRLLKEYMEVAPAYSDTKVIAKQFAALWNKFNFTKSKRRPKRLFPDGLLPAFRPNLKNIELVGIRQFVKHSKSHQQVENCMLLLALLLKEANKPKNKAFLNWLFFDNLELAKREKEFYGLALPEVRPTTRIKDLKDLGIETQQIIYGQNKIFKIIPGRNLALKNRIPEATKEEITLISKQDFSATAIFDILIANKFADAEHQLWMPRVYRILDTIADFQTFFVQPILITFHSKIPIKPFTTYLPLQKSNENRQAQDLRKKIISLFIVTTVYNYAISIGITSASVEAIQIEKEHAFKQQELNGLIRETAYQYGFAKTYDKFLENYNFKKFNILSKPFYNQAFDFKPVHMQEGIFWGIDIGGTNIKAALVKGSQVADVLSDNTPNTYNIISFPTLAPGEQIVPLDEFCRRIILQIEDLAKGTFDWSAIDGVGISWPGAVNNNQIVGPSKLLLKLKPASGKVLTYDASPQDIQSIDLAGVFIKELAKHYGQSLKETIEISVENDGNSEAFGNFCAMQILKIRTRGATAIIKLGTSLAGGHITASGGISDNVLELGKIVLDLNIQKASLRVEGAAREFISSIAVRKLSRTFKFDKKLVYGTCSGANDDDLSPSRIEANEVGEFLDFWVLAEGMDKPVDHSDYLKELADFDNVTGQKEYKNLIKKINAILKAGKRGKNMPFHQALQSFIRRRGVEQVAKIFSIEKNQVREMMKKEPGGSGKEAELILALETLGSSRSLKKLIWNQGLQRLHLLLSGKKKSFNSPDGVLPPDFDLKHLGFKTLGAVALFNQMALQMAHLVVSLYNIYGREKLKSVIMAGGVLSAYSGVLVQKQTERFLSLYYDKIFGDLKNLRPGDIFLAKTRNPEFIGPFGAAMVANRQHKLTAVTHIRKRVDAEIRVIRAGAYLPFESIQNLQKEFRVEYSEIIEYLNTLVSAGKLNLDYPDKYLKPVDYERPRLEDTIELPEKPPG